MSVVGPSRAIACASGKGIGAAALGVGARLLHNEAVACGDSRVRTTAADWPAGPALTLARPGMGRVAHVKAACPELSAGLLDRERLRAFVLVHIAAAVKGTALAELQRELTPLTAHRVPAPQGRALIARELEGLVAAGLVKTARTRVAASAAGASQAAVFLGLRSALTEFLRASDVGIVALTLAKALGLEREPGRRLKALATLEGLRAGIVQHAFGVKIKGAVTPARLRAALAEIAVERAFGNQLKTTGTLGLSPKTGRLLAGQLARKPREFGTDQRLIAALAAEETRTRGADLALLRLRVLQGYLDLPAEQPPSRPSAAPAEALHPFEAPPIARRPDLDGFASAVRGQAAMSAEGWAGNRRAYISHVWRRVRERHPEWGLSEIEFKSMLAEAHRAGRLLLANADLKDDGNLRDVAESALVYKNAVFHFVRVDV
jgi:hypothetical protein